MLMGTSLDGINKVSSNLQRVEQKQVMLSLLLVMVKMRKMKIMLSLKILGVMIGVKKDSEKFRSAKSLVLLEYVEFLAIVTTQQLKKFESNMLYF